MGEDVKTWLNDTTNWSNNDFATVRDTASNFLTIQQSWLEQRNWGVDFPVQALGDDPLAATMKAEFADAVAVAPNPVALGFTQTPLDTVFTTKLYVAGAPCTPRMHACVQVLACGRVHMAWVPG